MTWRLAVKQHDPATTTGAELLMTVILCHYACRRMTPACRLAVMGSDDGALGEVDPPTRAALARHGLAAGARLTDAGRAVRHWRPRGGA